MKDAKGLVIYVGKAKNLRVRVRQYFSGHDSRAQIAFLMKRVIHIDFLQTHTETEALLLENSLIKKHKPRYNVFLKDDKSYLGLKITVHEDYPRLMTTRRVKKDGALYFGPFTSSENLRGVKEFIDIFFQLRTCSEHEFIARKRPCLEFQIKRCSAPCVDYVRQKDYQKQIEQVLLFLTGKSATLKKSVKDKMKACALQEEFEEAARLRDLLQSMEMILKGQNVTNLNFDFVDVITFKRQEGKVGVAVLMIRQADLIDSRYRVYKTLEDDNAFLSNFILQYYTERCFIPKEIIIKEDLSDTKHLEKILSQRAQRKIRIKRAKQGKKKELLKLAEMNLSTHFAKDTENSVQNKVVLEKLKSKLHLKKLPKRIECYDVSNISGKYAVASLVTFTHAQKDTDQYRRFKIKTLDTPNDYAMLKEVFK
ncbi:MAG: excinuclease ABC subunit UvrC, partial [bacterium]